jgi:hypothetical protein
MKLFLRLSSCSLAVLLHAVLAPAQTAIYTFDSPQWVLNSITPLLNMAPDAGSAPLGFKASFSSYPTAGAFTIWTFALNPLFGGNNLGQPGLPPGDVLNITVSQPIRSVHLDFEQYAPGYLRLSSSAGAINATTDSQIGSLDFQGNTNFTQFSLQAIDTSNNPIPFGIDNLVLTIPEPSITALAGLCAACLAVRQQFRRSHFGLVASR